MSTKLRSAPARVLPEPDQITADKIVIDGSVIRSARAEGPWVTTSLTPHGPAATIVNAAVASYPKVGSQPIIDDLHASVDGRRKATVLYYGENAFGGSYITVQAGTLFASGGRLGLLAKRSRRNGVALDVVLDVVDGWGDTARDELIGRWAAAVHASYVNNSDDDTSAVEELLAAVPTDPSERIHAAAMYTHPGFGGGRTPGCIWFITDRQGDDGNAILNGYLWVPEGTTTSLVAEHGSILKSDLEDAAWVTDLRDDLTFGEVVQAPTTITPAEMLARVTV